MYSAGPRVPVLTILFHPDLSRVGERAVLWQAAADGEALLARRELAFRPPRGGPARPLDDPYVSRRPIRFAAARFGGVRLDCARTGTRVIANDDWISEDRVFLGVEVERGVVLVLAERVSLLLHNLELEVAETEAASDVPDFGLVGDSSPMLRLRREVRRWAGSRAPVLVRGEAGSGRTAAARAIHDAGGGERPWVTVALRDRIAPPLPDLLAQAAGGTLVLDAIDEMEAALLAELARSLATGRRDVRVLATGTGTGPRCSPGPLVETMVGGNVVEVPPLGCRRDDVGRLAFHFLRQELGKLDALHRLADPGPYAAPWFPVRLAAALASYEWPQNVRQLRRVARRLAYDNHERAQIAAAFDLEALLEEAEETSTGWGLCRNERGAVYECPGGELSEIEVLSALREHRWQAEPAAAHLGITPETLFAVMDELFNRGPRAKGVGRNFSPV